MTIPYVIIQKLKIWVRRGPREVLMRLFGERIYVGLGRESVCVCAPICVRGGAAGLCAC